jgi:hypothetical protein
MEAGMVCGRVHWQDTRLGLNEDYHTITSVALGLRINSIATCASVINSSSDLIVIICINCCLPRYLLLVFGAIRNCCWHLLTVHSVICALEETQWCILKRKMQKINVTFFYSEKRSWLHTRDSNKDHAKLNKNKRYSYIYLRDFSYPLNVIIAILLARQGNSVNSEYSQILKTPCVWQGYCYSVGSFFARYTEHCRFIAWQAYIRQDITL